MRKSKKTYKRPQKMWNKARIERDTKLRKDYGLVREREIWRAETLLRKYRRLARELVGTRDKEKEKELLKTLDKIGFLQKGSMLDDVLGLTVEMILERRLQTLVFKKGLANTPKQARQLIAHGHIAVNGRICKFPGRMMDRGEEQDIKIIMKKKKPKKIEANPVKQEEAPSEKDTAPETKKEEKNEKE